MPAIAQNSEKHSSAPTYIAFSIAGLIASYGAIKYLYGIDLSLSEDRGVLRDNLRNLLGIQDINIPNPFESHDPVGAVKKIADVPAPVVIAPAPAVPEALQPVAADPTVAPGEHVPDGYFDMTKIEGAEVSPTHPDKVYLQRGGNWFVYDRLMSGTQPTAYFDAYHPTKILECDVPKDIHVVCTDVPEVAVQPPAIQPVVEHKPVVQHPKVVKAEVISPVVVVPPVEPPPPEPPAPAPVETPKPIEAVKDPYSVYNVDLKCESGCDDQIGVVTREGMPPGSVWEDLDGDGDYVKAQRVPGSADHFAKEIVLDRQEVHLPDQATIDQDIEKLRERGFSGTTVVYNLTDTEGKNVVACYNTQTHHWDIFNKNHSSDPVEKIPPGHKKFHYILDSRTLNADLSFATKTY